MRVQKYLSASTFMSPGHVEEAGGELTVTILDTEEVELRDGPKLMLNFEDEHPGLVLNQTNLRALAKSFGGDSDDWCGNTIQLFLVDVDFHGEMKKGIRIRPLQRSSAPRPVPRGGKPDLDDAIPF